MSYSRTYGGLIWTNHALARLKGRRIPQEIAWRAFKHPETTVKGRKQGSFEFIKTHEMRTLSVIAKQNEKKEWLILSVWAEPPYPGSSDLKPKSSILPLFTWVVTKLIRMFSHK